MSPINQSFMSVLKRKNDTGGLPRTHVNELLLFSLKQILDGDPCAPGDDGGDVLTRHSIAKRRARCTSFALCSSSVVAWNLVLQGRDNLVPQTRRRLKVVVSLGDLEINLGSFQFLRCDRTAVSASVHSENKAKKRLRRTSLTSLRFLSHVFSADQTCSRSFAAAFLVSRSASTTPRRSLEKVSVSFLRDSRSI